MPLPISTIGAATITRVPTKRMPAAGYASFSFVKMATISSLARPCLANGCAAARHAACNVPRLILGQSVCCTQQPNIRSPHKWTAHAAIRRNRFGFVSGPRTSNRYVPWRSMARPGEKWIVIGCYCPATSAQQPSLPISKTEMTTNPQEPAIWRGDFRVHSYEVDFKQSATLECLCRYFQEAAWNHAEELGVGYQRLQAENKIWVLSR